MTANIYSYRSLSGIAMVSTSTLHEKNCDKLCLHTLCRIEISFVYICTLSAIQPDYQTDRSLPRHFNPIPTAAQTLKITRLSEWTEFNHLHCYRQRIQMREYTQKTQIKHKINKPALGKKNAQKHKKLIQMSKPRSACINKGKGRYSSSWEPYLRATGCHLPYGITYP